jgi:hypothetical protein
MASSFNDFGKKMFNIIKPVEKDDIIIDKTEILSGE